MHFKALKYLIVYRQVQEREGGRESTNLTSFNNLKSIRSPGESEEEIFLQHVRPLRQRQRPNSELEREEDVSGRRGAEMHVAASCL